MTRASPPRPGDYSLGIAGAVITMLQLAWFVRCLVLGMAWCGLTRQYLHRGVTYQSDWKDLADGVEYLYRGAKLKLVS
jgi:hypothetical protein